MINKNKDDFGIGNVVNWNNITNKDLLTITNK